MLLAFLCFVGSHLRKHFGLSRENAEIMQTVLHAVLFKYCAVPYEL